MLKEDLKLHAYKTVVEPKLTEGHKNKRKPFANWIFNHFRKEDTMRILISDEKMFDVSDIYNVRNQRMWAAGRT